MIPLPAGSATSVYSADAEVLDRPGQAGLGARDDPAGVVAPRGALGKRADGRAVGGAEAQDIVDHRPPSSSDKLLQISRPRRPSARLCGRRAEAAGWQ